MGCFREGIFLKISLAFYIDCRADIIIYIICTPIVVCTLHKISVSSIYLWSDVSRTKRTRILKCRYNQWLLWVLNSYSLTVLVSLDYHRVRRLALDCLEEWHQEEIVFCVLAEVGQCVRFGLSVVHHHSHHVVRLRATRQVSEPHVYTLYPFDTA